MRTLIRDSRTILATACLLLFAVCIELHSDPGAIRREQATSSSLRHGAVNVHMTLKRLLEGKRGLSSLTDHRHSGNELVSTATGVPVKLVRLAESASYDTAAASSVPQTRPFFIRPPPAS